jgi:hypothetical protein
MEQAGASQDPPQQIPPLHEVSSATGAFSQTLSTQSSAVHSLESSQSAGTVQPQSTAQLPTSSVPSQAPSPQHDDAAGTVVHKSPLSLQRPSSQLTPYDPLLPQQ